LQLCQEMQQNDLPCHYGSAADIASWIDSDIDYRSRVCFSDEGTFHILGNVNHHNRLVRGAQNSHGVREHERDSPKLNMWCKLTNVGVIGPFFFRERAVTDAVYIDMLENYAMP
jgi:hypothetical protein